MAPVWILSIVSSVLFLIVESKTSETITLSESSCQASVFYTVDETQEFHLVWNRLPYSRLPLSTECRARFDPIKSRSKICVEVESFHIQDCSIHVIYYDNEAIIKEKQRYGCYDVPGKFCAEKNDDVDIALSFGNSHTHKSRDYFRLKIYAEPHAHKHEDYTWVIGLVAVVAVTAGIVVFFIIICRRKRSTGTIFRNNGIPHTRLINTVSDPPPTDLDLPPPYPGNETVTSEYTVTVPVVVNTRQIV